MSRSLTVPVFALALMAALVAPPPAPVQAAQVTEATRTETVRFARGTSSASLRGRVKGYDTVDYIVGARAGQRMTVSMRTSNASSYFNVLAPGSEGEALPDAATVTDWSGALSASGPFRVRVYLMRNAARRAETADYILNIAVR